MEPEKTKDEEQDDKVTFWEIWKMIGTIGYMLPILLIGGFFLLLFGYAFIYILKSLF